MPKKAEHPKSSCQRRNPSNFHLAKVRQGEHTRAYPEGDS